MKLGREPPLSGERRGRLVFIFDKKKPIYFRYVSGESKEICVLIRYRIFTTKSVDFVTLKFATNMDLQYVYVVTFNLE